MKRIFTVAAFTILLVLGTRLRAQTFNGTLNLTTQAQVDAFNYTSVTGDLILFGTAITNLNGLSELQTVGGKFEVSTTAITHVDALSNLQSVSSFLIRGNSLLTNLNGFSNVTSVPHGFHFQNNSMLTNFDGLLGVTGIVEGIEISNCPMANLNGFSGITDITGFIELEGNPNLSNVDALQGLAGTDVVNSIKIISNPVLQHLNGLLSIKYAGGITIRGNNMLTSLGGLSSLLSAVDIIIESNAHLGSVNGLTGIQTMPGSLWIRSNSLLTDIDGVSGLTSLGRELIIDVNPALTNINGLSNLTSVGTNIIVASNAHLTNVNGFQNLTTVGNDLKINLNITLIDFCGLSKLFNLGTIGGIVEIKNNGANTLSITPPADIILNNDPGLCTRDISAVAPAIATVTGCLKPSPVSSTPYPPGNIFPVGTTNITWSSTDAAGNTASAIQKIIINDNEPPVITQFPANTTVACAASVPAVNTNLVTATDNCPTLNITHEGDVITNQTCANRFTLTRTYKATDGSGNSVTRDQVIIVNDDVPPQINGLSTSKQLLAPPNHKMVDIVVNYTVTDNCVSTPNYSISITSNEPINGTGDGDTDPDWEIVDDHHIRLRAERAATGTGRIYTITITADDGCNQPVTSTTQVRVAHNITAPHAGRSFRVGSTVNFEGVFWDRPGTTHTSKWLLDGSAAAGGTVTEPSAVQNGKVTGSYRFNTPGVYKLQMNITDRTGVTTYANTNGDLEAMVVIYDPNGGYTYGGGWFASPAGALVANPAATGKAGFGYAVNYRNATNPKGETQFEFKVGDFEFNALNFDYLVVSGYKAQFKGTGKITGGQSGIAFIMTVIDGALDGTGVDKVRMKIYNRNTNAVIYDNQPGASDAADPKTPVGINSEIFIQGSGNSPATSNNRNEFVSEFNSTDDFNVMVYPNPSDDNFSLIVPGDVRKKISMLVMDIYGRVIETRKVMANSIIRFGDRYPAGTYFLNIIQGNEHQKVRLVKISN